MRRESIDHIADSCQRGLKTSVDDTMHAQL
jgi:hypothetical protein